METPIQFWKWFRENNKAYTFLHSIDEETKEKLLNSFLEQLHKYCANIYFEIGGLPDEDQELIITAEGNKNYFDKVEQLVNAAPRIEGWKLIAFKPAMPDHFTSKWNDLELNTENLWFLPLSNAKNKGLGIRVCFNNQDSIKDSDTLRPFLYKMLDTIVGEKAFALDIHYVDTDDLPKDPEEKGLHPILELPKYIEWHKSKVTNSSS